MEDILNNYLPFVIFREKYKTFLKNLNIPEYGTAVLPMVYTFRDASTKIIWNKNIIYIWGNYFFWRCVV